MAAALVLATTAAYGAERFVTDQLRINMRSGAGNEYRIEEILETGTALQTLAREGEWTQVRLADSTTGWVRSQYLTDTPVAAVRLEEARNQLQQAQARVGELETQLEQSRASLAAARERVQALEETQQAMRQRLEDAKQGLKLSDENQRLRQTVADLENRIETVKREASRLADRTRREWFMIGAGVLFAGLLFGIIVTRIPWRRSGRERMF